MATPSELLGELDGEDDGSVEGELLGPEEGRVVFGRRTARDEAIERHRKTEDQLYERAAGIVEGALGFAEIDPADPHIIPQAWIDELGPEEAAKRHRVAMFALSPKKDAPVGLEIAQRVHSSITKARAKEKGDLPPLNINVVQMSAPLPQFAEVLDEPEKDA